MELHPRTEAPFLCPKIKTPGIRWNIREIGAGDDDRPEKQKIVFDYCLSVGSIAVHHILNIGNGSCFLHTDKDYKSDY